MTGGPIDIRGIAELTDRVSPVLRQISAGMRRVAGDAKFNALAAQGRAVTAAFGGVGAAVRRVGINLAALSISYASVQGALAGFSAFTVKAFADAGGGLADLAAKTGLSAEKLQELRHAAMLTGVDSEGLSNALVRLNKVLAEAQAGKNELALEYFKRMGINIRGAKIEDILPKIAEAFRKNGNEAQRTAAAMALFGKAGAGLIPMLIGGKKGLEDTAKEARDLGLIISNADVEAADNLGDNLDRLSKAVQGLGIQIGAKLAPVIGPVIEDMLEWVKANREWITSSIADGLKELIWWLKDFDIKATADSLRYFMGQTNSFVQMVGGWTQVLIGLGFILSGPLISSLVNIGANIIKLAGIVLGVGGWAVVLGLGVIAGVINNWDAFTAAIGRAIDGVRKIFQGNIMEGFAQIFQANIDAAVAVVEGFVDLIGRLIGVDLIGKIAEGASALRAALETYLLGPFRTVVDTIKSLIDSIRLPTFSAPGVPETAPAPGENRFRPPAAGPMPLPSAAPQRTGSLLDQQPAQPGRVLAAAAQAGAISSPAQTVRGEGTVTVRFSNAPPGTQADTSSSGGLFKLRQGDMGYAMAGVG